MDDGGMDEVVVDGRGRLREGGRNEVVGGCCWWWKEVEGGERWRKSVRGRGGVDDSGGRVWLLVVGGRKEDSWEGVSIG